jgi:hypothetical protein
MLTWLTSDLDSRPLGLARIVVGVAAVIRSIVAWPVLTALTQPDILRVPYADWVPTPTLPLAVAIVVVWFVSALLFMVGWRVSLTGPALTLAIVATLSLDQQTYSNHLYLMAWLVLLMTLADAGAGITIGKPDRTIARWPLLLIMLQISVVYGFSAVTKLNATFLSGVTLARVLRDGVIPFPDTLRTPAILSVLAATVVFVELFIAVMLWRSRFRPAAFIFGLGLHASITLTMAGTAQLFVFSMEMLAVYPLFLSTEVLAVTAPTDSPLRRRTRRVDLLRIVEFVGASDTVGLRHLGRVTRGSAAHTRLLEHLVPWLWFAPLLRLPGLRHLHQFWCHASSGNPRRQTLSSRGLP